MNGSKSKGNSMLTGKKGALLIIVGSLISGALFFLIAQSFDVFIRTITPGVPPKLLPFSETPQPAKKGTHPAPAPEHTPPPKLSFYKTLVQKEQVHVPLAKSKPSSDKKNGQAPAGANKKHPEESAVQTQQPEKGSYLLQLGAFQQQEKAQSLVNELKKKGYAAYAVTKDIPGRGTLIKVCIGGFSDRATAQKKAAEIEKSLQIRVIIARQ